MITIADIERSFSAMPPTSTRVWVESQLAKGVHSECVILTPDIAAELLSRNDSNRKLSIAQMERYATEIAHGNWQLNGEPIIVSKDGKLNDGQHRCAAVVKTGVAINTIIVFGVERESRSTVDVGVKRTIGAHLSMLGWPYANTIAHAAAFLLRFEADGGLTFSLTKKVNVVGAQQRPSVSDIIAWVDAHPSITHSAHVAAPLRPLGFSAGLGAALHWLFAQKSLADADQFFSLLATGDSLNSKDHTSGILHLRNRIITKPSKKHTNNLFQEIPTQTFAALTIKAWNAWRARQPMKRLSWPAGENFPVVR